MNFIPMSFLCAWIALLELAQVLCDTLQLWIYMFNCPLCTENFVSLNHLPPFNLSAPLLWKSVGLSGRSVTWTLIWEMKTSHFLIPYVLITIICKKQLLLWGMKYILIYGDRNKSSGVLNHYGNFYILSFMRL